VADASSQSSVEDLVDPFTGLRVGVCVCVCLSVSVCLSLCLAALVYAFPSLAFCFYIFRKS